MKSINTDKTFWREEKVKRVAKEENERRHRNQLRAIDDEREINEKKLKALKEMDKSLTMRKLIMQEEEEKKRQILSFISHLNIIS